jgi:signal transduction histidine kinase
VSAMIEQHGGTVELVSQEGHGTTVTVRLPLLVDDDGSPEPDETAARS